MKLKYLFIVLGLVAASLGGYIWYQRKYKVQSGFKFEGVSKAKNPAARVAYDYSSYDDSAVISASAPTPPLANQQPRAADLTPSAPNGTNRLTGSLLSGFKTKLAAGQLEVVNGEWKQKGWN